MPTAICPTALEVLSVWLTLAFAAAYSLAKLNPVGFVPDPPKVLYQLAAAELEGAVVPETIKGA